MCGCVKLCFMKNNVKSALFIFIFYILGKSGSKFQSYAQMIIGSIESQSVLIDTVFIKNSNLLSNNNILGKVQIHINSKHLVITSQSWSHWGWYKICTRLNEILID